MQKGVCLEKKKVKCSEVRHSVQIQVVLVISDLWGGGCSCERTVCPCFD